MNDRVTDRSGLEEGDDPLVDLFRALADPVRIRLAAAMMEQPRPIDALAAVLGLPVPAVARHLQRLERAGLVAAGGDGAYAFQQQPLFDVLRSLSPKPAAPDLDEDLDAFDRKVLTDFMDGGRLRSIPVQQKKRDAVLRFLVERFEPDRMYTEQEVNAILKDVHEDVATLRRTMVDGAFLQRRVIRETEITALESGTPKATLFVRYWRPAPTT